MRGTFKRYKRKQDTHQARWFKKPRLTAEKLSETSNTKKSRARINTEDDTPSAETENNTIYIKEAGPVAEI